MKDNEEFWDEVNRLGPWLFAYTFFDKIVPHMSSKQAHEVVARRFDTFMRATKEARIPNGSALIDFPCGDGYYAIRFAQQGFKVRGYDVRPDNIERARFAARYFEVDIDFDTANFNDTDSIRAIEHADIVACLGYFYHALNPFLVYKTLRMLSLRYILMDSTVIKSKEAYFRLEHEGSEHLGHAVEGVRLYPTKPAFFKSAEYSGLLKIADLKYDSLGGKTVRGYQWVGGIFLKSKSKIFGGTP
jgi:2-polyprenyl-3-methyl-5-hydroxy-6-metoxy-1,4-benzoquinol methylase